MMLYISVVHPVLLRDSIPLNDSTAVCLLIKVLVDILVVTSMTKTAINILKRSLCDSFPFILGK